MADKDVYGVMAIALDDASLLLGLWHRWNLAKIILL